MLKVGGVYTEPPPRRWKPLRGRNRRRTIFFWWIPLELFLVGVVTWGLNLGITKLADPMTLPIKEVRVVGKLRHITPTMVEQALMPIVTGGLLRVDLRAVQQAALTLPWVADAQVRRLWPETLRIVIAEQEPVARWLPGGLVNRDGVLFTPDPATYPENLPGLRGSEPALMLQHLRRLDQVFAFLNLTVTTLEVDERRAWAITLSNNIQLLLGKKDLDNRLARFLRIYPSALASQAERILRIDLRYSNGFAVAWKKTE